VLSVVKTLTPEDLQRPLPAGAAWPTVGVALSHLAVVENAHLDDVESAMTA